LAGDGFSQTTTTGTLEIGTAFAEMSNRRDFETYLRHGRGGYVYLLVMTKDVDIKGKAADQFGNWTDPSWREGG
jgi:hypothetical protein